MSILLRRREFIAGLGGAAAWPLTATGQQAGPVRRVGMFARSTAGSPLHAQVDAFKRVLAELGWAEGRNLRFEERRAAIMQTCPFTRCNWLVWHPM